MSVSSDTVLTSSLVFTYPAHSRFTVHGTPSALSAISLPPSVLGHLHLVGIGRGINRLLYVLSLWRRKKMGDGLLAALELHIHSQQL